MSVLEIFSTVKTVRKSGVVRTVALLTGRVGFLGAGRVTRPSLNMIVELGGQFIENLSSQPRTSVSAHFHWVPVESYFTRSLLAASLFSYERRPALSRVRGSRGRARCESVARAMGRSNGDMVFEVRRLFCRPACWPFYGSASVVAFFWLDLLSRAARP